jgi:myosin-5
MLTPTQIQKLINVIPFSIWSNEQQYYTADYEPPISPEIQKAVAARVMAEGGNEKLLLDAVPLDDSGEYEIPDPRPLEQLETYVPSCNLSFKPDLTLQGCKFQISAS